MKHWMVKTSLESTDTRLLMVKTSIVMNITIFYHHKQWNGQNKYRTRNHHQQAGQNKYCEQNLNHHIS